VEPSAGSKTACRPLAMFQQELRDDEEKYASSTSKLEYEKGLVCKFLNLKD